MNWQCMYCDTVIETETEDERNEQGRQHLLEHHHTELEQRFKREYTGDCQNQDCSHHFEATDEDEDHSGFVCPHCGFDHAEWYAGMLTVE
jgi:hypothetical protein